ncbi:ABC transporter permease [Actinoallomurus iriomotensis]|uniref:Ribose ABC transporter permease n=1 Tax=Actinoallomurus iriomotensis TaxID=478107 RepID=A0A9W6S0V3_9ACTN|nr:ABC transporter permease [Actinoallomurus iriomotensis]GLY85188.1 ribose ABC transporter permease [Actinoallomurus iriomotensis]
MSTSAETELENSAPTEPVSRAGRGTQLAMLFLRGRTLIVLIVLVIMFSLISGDYLTTSNLLLMSKHVSITGLMAIGVTFVILTGGIDLSVGSVAGLAGMIAGGLLYEGLKLPGGDTLWFSTVMVIALAILAGAVVGLINGLLVTKLKVAPFIATLGVLYAARGLADLRSNGATFPNLAGSPARHNTGFSTLGIKSWLGVPVAIWIMVLVAAVAVLITTRTPFGRRVYAVGGNERAAELAGIRTSRVKIAAYVISGACAALAGLILTSELGAAYPDTATTYELNAIAAAVLGGTSLTGGKGTIIGTIVGALVIGFLSDGLVLVGVSSFWQLVVKGTVIVLAVVMEQTQERVKTRMTT